MPILACGAKVARWECGTITRQCALHGDAQGLEVIYGVSEEVHRTRCPLVRIHVGKTDTVLMVGRDEQEFPALSINRVATITGNPMTHVSDTTKLLGVEMDHLVKCFALIANLRCGPPQVPQERQAGVVQHPYPPQWGTGRGNR